MSVFSPESMLTIVSISLLQLNSGLIINILDIYTKKLETEVRGEHMIIPEDPAGIPP